MDLKLSLKGQLLLSKVAMPTLLRQSFGANPLPSISHSLSLCIFKSPEAIHKVAAE